MSKPTTKLIAALRDDDGDTNDQLYRLAQVVRLAAFASEAQRCLEAYSDAVRLHPDCEKHLKQCSSAVSNWTTHEINIGDILTDVAFQIEQIGERLDMRLVRGPLATGGGGDE